MDETGDGKESHEQPIRKVIGSKIPLYLYPKSKSVGPKKIRSFGNFDELVVPDMDDQGLGGSPMRVEILEDSSESSYGQIVPQRSLLDSLLLSEWEDRAEEGLFRYDVTACPSKTIEGTCGFIAQLNEGRASKKRPTEFRVDKVDQPFDDSKFNFCKAIQREALFEFEEGKAEEPDLNDASIVSSSPNLVMINVSPIEYGHILLVPRVLDNLQQLVTSDTLLLALKFAHEANNPFLRMGYNSLGAYATINHLHFQAYYLAAAMPLERARSVQIAVKNEGNNAIRIHKLVDYPVNGLVFESSQSLEDMASLIGGICKTLTERNIPHNLMIADCGARVFLIPNAFSQRKAQGELPGDVLDSQVDPAVFEISGHILLKRMEDYVNITEEWVWKLLSCSSVSEEVFNDVVSKCI